MTTPETAAIDHQPSPPSFPESEPPCELPGAPSGEPLPAWASAGTAGELTALSLEEFARAGLVLEIVSPMLEDTFLLASDNARIGADEERVVYRAAELAHLEALGPDGVKQIHRLKRSWGGSVVGVTAKLSPPARKSS